MANFTCYYCGQPSSTYHRRKWWRYVLFWLWNRKTVCTPCYFRSEGTFKR